MSKDFISDEEMKGLESAGKAKDFISDEEMAALDKPKEKKTYSPEAAARGDYSDEFSEEDLGVGTTVGEGLSAGFVHGVPFLEKGMAAVQAAKDTWDSGKEWNFDNLTDSYEENLADQDIAMGKASDAQGAAFFAGEVGAGVSTGMLMGPGVKAAAGFGALEGASQSRADDLGEFAQDVAGGVAAGVVGEGIGQAIGKGFSKAKKFLKTEGDAGAVEILGLRQNKSAKQAFFQHMQRADHKTTGEFIENIEKLTNRNGQSLADFADNPTKLHARVKESLSDTGDDIARFYKSDMKDIKINPEELKADLLSSIVEPMTRTADEVKLASKIGTYIENTFKGKSTIKRTIKDGILEETEEILPMEDLTMDQLHSITKRISKEVDSVYKQGEKMVSSASDVDYSKVKKKVDQNIRQFMTNKVDDLGGDIAKEAKGKIRKLNKDYSDLKLVDKWTSPEVANEATTTPMGTFREGMGDFIKNMRAGGTLAVGAGAVGGGLVGGPIGMIALPTIIHAAMSPRTPLYLSRKAGLLQKVLSQGGKQMGDRMPKGSEAILRRAFNKLDVATSLSMYEFNTHTQGALAEAELSLNPLSRDVREIKESNFEDIYKVLDSKRNSDMKKMLKDAVESGDEDRLGSMLDAVSKLPEASQFFQPGMGFNGKVYSIEDKMQLLKNLKGTLNMNAVQKRQMQKALMDGGIVPNMEEIKTRERIQPKKRAKFRHQY